jgi:hypothetical protein
MSFENKIMRLIAGVKTRQDMRKLFKYFEDNNIELPDTSVRTALNKMYLLPEDNSNGST